MRKKLLTSFLAAFLLVGMPQAFAIYDTWTQVGSSASWTAVACSTTCDIAAAARTGGYIAIAKDGGGAWVDMTTSGSRNWTGLAMSADGQIIYATVNAGNIYKSIDAGSTWSALSSVGTASWKAISTSSDGNIVLATTNSGSGYLWSSIDGGTNWVSETSPGAGTWTATDMNSSGSYVVAVNTGGGIWLGTGTAGSWSWSNVASGKTSGTSNLAPSTVTMSSQQWKGAAISSIGTVIAVVASDVFISSDSGATWVRASQGNYAYIGITGTSDLKTLMFASSGGCGTNCKPHVVTTTNYTSFTDYMGLGAYTPIWSALTMSASGNRAIASSSTYLYQSGPLAIASTISLSASASIFRTSSTITATLYPTTGGRVTFYANGKKIGGCISLVASSSTRQCNWKPSFRGSVNLTAKYIPTDSSATVATSAPLPTKVSERTGVR